MKCGNEIFTKIKRKNISDKLLYKKYNVHGFKNDIVLLEEKIFMNTKRIINFIRRYI